MSLLFRCGLSSVRFILGEYKPMKETVIILKVLFYANRFEFYQSLEYFRVQPCLQSHP